MTKRLSGRAAARKGSARSSKAAARHRRLFFEQMEDRRMLDASPWTNMALAEDVDFDTFVTGTDL